MTGKVVYGMKPDGELRWYRHDGWQDGSTDWTAGDGGRQVGTGWNMYSKLFSGDDGVVYGVRPDGELRWYRHDGWQDGSTDWTAGDGGRQVGTGWNMYSMLFSSGEPAT